jgi:hypothetical protein
MRLPRMTTRRWMVVVAGAAVLFTVMSRLHCDRSGHPFYWANKAEISRRFERWKSSLQAECACYIGPSAEPVPPT